MRTTLRLLALLCAALFSIPAPAQPASTAPATYNLHRVAYDIVNAGDGSKGVGHVNVLIVGDSLNTPQGVGGRGGVAIRDAFKPYRWSGFFGHSAFTQYNVTANPLDQTYVSTIAFNNATGYPNYTPGTSTPTNGAATWGMNHYDYVSGVLGDRNQTVQNTLTDSHTGSPVTPTTVSTTFSPFAYREFVFSGNPGTSEIMGGVSFDYRNLERFNSTSEPNTTASTAGNWAAKNDIIRCRLIYYASSLAPASLQWVPTRGNTISGSAVTFNPNTATGIRYVDCDITASSTSNNANRPYPEIRGGSGDETGTVLPIIAFRTWRPNSPGLELNFWCQSGFNLLTMADGAIWDLPSRAEYFEAIGWPDIVQVWLGQNQTTTESTELNAGVSTQFKADYRTFLATIDNAYTTGGRQRPRYVLISSYCLSAEMLTASSRNATNYKTMDEAIYEIARERGCSFVSFYQMSPTPHEAQGDVGVYVPLLYHVTDDVHVTYAGSMYYYSALWSAYRSAAATPPASPRGRRRHAGRERWGSRRGRRRQAHADRV